MGIAWVCYNYKRWRVVNQFVKFLQAGTNLEANIPLPANIALAPTLGLATRHQRNEKKILDRIRALRPAALEDGPLRTAPATLGWRVRNPADWQAQDQGAGGRVTLPHSSMTKASGEDRKDRRDGCWCERMAPPRVPPPSDLSLRPGASRKALLQLSKP